MYKRLNITLPHDVLARADAFAAQERYTRSGLIAAALDSYLSAESAEAPPGQHHADVPVAEEATSTYAPAAAQHADTLALEKVVLVLRAFFSGRDDVEAAWVFGSVARGETWAMSDVDVAILPAAHMTREAWFALRMQMISRLPAVLGVEKVDVAVLPEVSVVLGFEIASEGVQVFGEGSRRAAEAIISAVTEYWDYEPVCTTARDALGERMGAYGRGE